MSEEQTEQKRGLSALSDELLAAIVENDAEGYGSIQTPIGHAAFDELSRRTNEDLAKAKKN